MNKIDINKNNNIDKLSNIDEINNIIKRCETTSKYELNNDSIYNIKSKTEIQTNCGIININKLNIKYIIDMIYKINNKDKRNMYTLFIYKKNINDMKLKYNKNISEIKIEINNKKHVYYSINNIFICNINDVNNLLPELDNKYKQYNIKHIIYYLNNVNNKIKITSNNYIWYLIVNNRNLYKLICSFPKNLHNKFIYDHYININIDINHKYNYEYEYESVNYQKDYMNDNIQLYKLLNKIYKNEFYNFNENILTDNFNKILHEYNKNKYNKNYKLDVLLFFINEINKLHQQYKIDLSHIKDRYICCILYDYPDKFCITKCCNNILDYYSAIEYFYNIHEYNPQKCCICRKELDEKIDNYIYVFHNTPV